MKNRILNQLKILVIFIQFILIVCTSCKPFTIALIPDTQYYTEVDPDTYYAQIEWIVENKKKENIEFVIHLGDITDDNTENQWKVANRAHHMLDEANIPYSMIPGNHDNPEHGRKRNTSKYNTYFGPTRFLGKKWYGGHMGNKNDNNYIFFEVEHLKFMVVNLEFAPTKDALCWADNLIKNYPDRRVIIVTHCYLDHDATYRLNCATGYNIVGSSGQTVWNEFVRRHSNIFMVLCGHVNDSEIKISNGNSENSVYEILTDYQFEKRNGKNHGNGWMRTLKFAPNKDSIYVKTFTVLNGVTSFNRNDYPPYPIDPIHTYNLYYSMNTESNEYNYKKLSNSFKDYKVNSNSDRQQKKPSAAIADNGDFVIVWEDDSKGTEGVYQIYARGFYAGGCQKFTDITVNADYHGQQLKPAIAMAPDGSFVVAWEDDKNENNIYQIYAAGFNVNGTKRFNDIIVNADYHGQQLKPAIAIAPDGSFVVSWEDDKNENNVYQIYAAGFNANGSKRFNDITVNADYHGQQLKPAIAMAADGSFVVAWEDDKNENNIYQIYAAGFNANGSKRFNDITVNADNHGQQLKPAIAMAADGSFVVAWEDDKNGNNLYQIYAAGFNANGSKRFNDITVNADYHGQQLKPTIAMAADGSFVVAWEDDKNGNNLYQIYAAGFNANGSKQFGDITVNANRNGQQLRPVIAVASDGSFVVAWEDDIDGNGYYEILTRGLDKNGN